MKSNLCFVVPLLLLVLSVTRCPGQTKKVLVIGVDGIRPDAMEAASTPNIDALIANGTYSRNATTSDLTFSGPGWTDILFGIHRNLHGVATNSTSTNPNNPAFQIFSGSSQHQFNDLLAIAKNADPGLVTARWTTWLPLHTTRTPGGTDYTFFHDYTNGGDDVATADAANYYNNNDADVGFFYFSDVDVAGHTHGFNPGVAAYRNEIESTDALIGQFVGAIQNRPGYLDGSEDWIFILASDHGGNLGGGHSGNAPWQREVPFIVSGDSVQNQLLGYDAKTVDVVTTALAHLGIIAPAHLAGHSVGLNGIPDPRPAIVLEQNLIFNGDAEYDQGFTTNGMDQAITGWNEFPDANFLTETSSRSGGQSITVLEYGSPGGFPTVAGPGPTDRGDNFFSPGSALGQSGTSLMRQTIDVRDLAATIDANLVYVKLSAFLGGYSTQPDKADLVARFYAADGVSLLSQVIVNGPSAAQRSNTTGLFFRNNAGSVMAGTRWIELELRTIGNDGYADNLSCVLTTTPPPPPPAISPVCLYEFQDTGNLGAATIGNDLLINNPNATIATVAGISSIAGDLAATVGVGDSFSLRHGILANNGGVYVNQYSVVYDVFLPAASDGTWRSLLQTNLDNSNDGDYYLRDTDDFIGVSAIGYVDAGLTTGNWYRIVFSADIGNLISGGTGSFLTTVVDESGNSATYDHAFQDLDGRHSWYAGNMENLVHFFADDNGDDGELQVTQLAIYDQALTGSELASLGAPGTSLVPGPGIIFPDSVTTTRGVYVGGDAASLSESDNSDYQLQRLGTDVQSRTEFEVKSTSPTATPTRFEFTLEGSVFARSNVIQSIELFDYVGGAWEIVDSRNAARSPAPDSVVTATPTGDLSRFVEPGTMCIEARIHFQSDNPRQRFASNTDQAVWTIQ